MNVVARGVLEECIRLTKPEGDIIQMANLVLIVILVLMFYLSL